MDLLAGKPHGVIERPMRRPIGAFGGVTARQPRFQFAFGVHKNLSEPNRLYSLLPSDPEPLRFSRPGIYTTASRPRSVQGRPAARHRCREILWLKSGVGCVCAAVSLNLPTLCPRGHRFNAPEAFRLSGDLPR